MGKSLYTIGYEGAELGDFLSTLVSQNIRQVIDIRELPLSRKRGFSKNALRQALADRGIAYFHIKALGDPKPGRVAARAGDFAKFRELYSRHLNLRTAQEGLLEVKAIVTKGTSVLLCYELDFVNCHRSIVATSLSKNHDFTVKHISVRKASETRSSARHDANKGIVALG